MIFQQVDEIVNGTKIQTRRVQKPNEHLWIAPGGVQTVITRTVTPRVIQGGFYSETQEIKHIRERIKWQVGRTYAVVPRRGQPGVWWQPEIREWVNQLGQSQHELMTLGYKPLRIRLTAIRLEHVQDISEADAVAEGCAVAVYDWVAAGEVFQDELTARQEYEILWDSINTRKPYRWEDDPLCWCLTFEVVR